MKITDVEVAWIRMPLPAGRGLSGGPITASSDMVCRVTTADGIRGIGEARGAPLDVMAEIVNEALRLLLLGQDPSATQHLRTMFERALLGPDAASRPETWTRAAVLGAMAAVDLALWDIKAKAANLSITRLLGGVARPMPAYCSAGFFMEGQTNQEMAAESLAEVRERGFRAVKIRVGRGEPSESEERVRLMREAAGPDVEIMVDANQAWVTDQAIAHARAMEPYGISWLEEPLPSPKRGRGASGEARDWDAETGTLAAATSIPIAAGENHTTLAECRDLVDKGCAQYMQFDCIKNGGLTEFQKVAAYAEAKGVRLAPHHVPHFHVQIAAAHAHTAWVEAFDNAKQHVAWLGLFTSYPEVRDGNMECYDRPGWGFEIDDAFLRQHGTLVHWRT